jgi:predicted nucleotidyltransferase
VNVLPDQEKRKEKLKIERENGIFAKTKTREMGYSPEYIRLLREYKQQHASQYGITRLGIFGSVARGEQTESSDIDIIMESSPISLLTVIGIKYELEDLLGVPVDLVRMHDRMNSRLKNRITKEAIYV